MNIILKRMPCKNEGQFGEFTDEDGVHLCFTAEHQYSGEVKIPEGTYTCSRRFSHKFKREVFMVDGVEGHTNIEIHYGNDPQVDSDGCILVGLGFNGFMVLRSREAFQDFMDLQKNVNQFTLNVVGS